MYCTIIVGIFGGIKIWQIAIFFCLWQILIWRMARHVSLIMCKVNENNGLNFVNGEKIANFTKITPLQNYPLYGIVSLMNK